MGKLTGEDIKQVAALAKLNLTEGEIPKFQEQLTKVISHISELKEVNTGKIEPTNQTTGLINVFRTDKLSLEECLTSNEVLSQANDNYNNYFVVEPLLDKSRNE